MTDNTPPAANAASKPATAKAVAERGGHLLKVLFVKLGVLPFLLIIALIVFTLMSDNFLTGRNLMNVLRQSVYLTIVSMGQMFALLTGGFDLSQYPSIRAWLGRVQSQPRHVRIG